MLPLLGNHCRSEVLMWTATADKRSCRIRCRNGFTVTRSLALSNVTPSCAPAGNADVAGDGVTVDPSLQAVRNAAVGDIRDARIAGSSPASAPITMAAAMPPDHALAGMTTAQPFALA